MTTNTIQDSEMIIQKLPVDNGIHRIDRKGTLKAPQKIISESSIEGKIFVDEVFPNEFSLQETQKEIYNNTKDLIKHGKSLLSVGGDHSVSYPTIKALKEENPDLKLIWLDAHLDLKKKIDQYVSHDVVVRELLKQLFDDDEIIFVGTTKIDEDEEKYLKEKNLKIFNSGELEEFIEGFEKHQEVYLSVDIDVLRKDLAPGTGYPDGNLSLEKVLEVIKCVSPDHADIVETAPPLDKQDRTLNNSKVILKNLKRELMN